MPNIKSAKKQMKQGRRRMQENQKYMKQIVEVVKATKKGVKSKKDEFVSHAYSIIDKASKKNVIHDNKANRFKRKIRRLMKQAS